MKVVLCAVNAKYIHVNLAVRSLAGYARGKIPASVRLSIAEYTINQRPDFLFRELCALQADVLAFSCYIWNIELIKGLLADLKQVNPSMRIVLGGPEVSYDAEQVLLENPAVDCVICGEGERAFAELLCRLADSTDCTGVCGIAARKNGRIVQNPPQPPLDLAALPFPYEDFSAYADRILYYEASRGCPYQCQYCLSSVEQGVRFKPLSLVKRELQRFLDAGVRQVKFVDRTFNCNKAFALEIWRYLHAHDNGATNFHFEISADLLDSETLDFLRRVRPGQFQFEIGVQTTNPETTGIIRRGMRFSRIAEVSRALQRGGNIHQHLDLIAGLPGEDYASFRQSFNDVYALAPDQLQLGFLKLLKGSGLRRDSGKYGIRYREKAPYEVLATHALPYDALDRLKDVEEMVEQYYNSARFDRSVRWLAGQFETPFDFFEALGGWYRESGLYTAPHAKLDAYTFLWRFYAERMDGGQADTLAWLLKFDLYRHEKAKKLPDWLTNDRTRENRARIFAFYEKPGNIEKWLPQYAAEDPKRVSKLAHLEVFPFDILSGDCGTPRETCVLFNYRDRDILGRAGICGVTL